MSDCKDIISEFRDVLYFKKWPHEKLFEKAQDQEFETKIAAYACEGKNKQLKIESIDKEWNLIIKNLNKTDSLIRNLQDKTNDISYGMNKIEFLTEYENTIQAFKTLCSQI